MNIPAEDWDKHGNKTSTRLRKHFLSKEGRQKVLGDCRKVPRKWFNTIKIHEKIFGQPLPDFCGINKKAPCIF